MNERENMLARVREALRRQAPLPGHDKPRKGKGPPRQGGEAVRQWLPAVGGTERERLELFERNCVALKAVFQLLGSEAELLARMREMAGAQSWKRAAIHAGRLTDLVGGALDIPVLGVDAGYVAPELEQCDVGITECDALIAQTGSVLVTSRSAGGRALSVLPPHHVVLARREQLLADLPEAFVFLKRNYGANYPSFISFITGPSRTGDIERILVLGAHGPKQLTILCI